MKVYTYLVPLDIRWIKIGLLFFDDSVTQRFDGEIGLELDLDFVNVFLGSSALMVLHGIYDGDGGRLKLES